MGRFFAKSCPEITVTLDRKRVLSYQTGNLNP